jgi:predicted nucleotidyltransferase component of viral defense system
MLNTKKHKEEMLKILKAIFTSAIAKRFWFKWWTLTYLCYWLDRFSTDIDLDILDIQNEQEIIDTMRELLLTYWEIKNETLWKTLHRWIYRYDIESENIKVELNKRIRKSNTYEFKNIEWLNIRTMKKESIFWNKIVALSERFKNRDLYDVNFFLKNKFPLNEDIIKERTWKDTSTFINHLIDEIPEHYTPNSILFDLWKVLTDKQKIWMKNKCLNETIELLKWLNKWLNK